MNTLRKIAIVLLVCISAGTLTLSCKSGSDSGSIASNGSVDLKLNFKPGDKFLYATKIEQKITSLLTMDQSTLMEMIYTYTGEEGGNKKLSITYDHIVVNMATPMGKIDYDSKSTQPRENGMDLMDSLIGKSFNITVAPDGNIKVDGDLVKAMGPSNGMSGQFNDTVIKHLMQNSFDIYPGKAVKVGDTWNKKTEMSLPMGAKINVDNTYTLKAVEGDKATIAMVSDLSLPKTDIGGAGGMEMKGKQEGTMEVLISTGQIISGKTKQDIKGSMRMEGMGQPIPIDIKGDITLTSKKL